MYLVLFRLAAIVSAVNLMDYMDMTRVAPPAVQTAEVQLLRHVVAPGGTLSMMSLVSRMSMYYYSI